MLKFLYQARYSYPFTVKYGTHAKCDCAQFFANMFLWHGWIVLSQQPMKLEYILCVCVLNFWTESLEMLNVKNKWQTSTKISSPKPIKLMKWQQLKRRRHWKGNSGLLTMIKHTPHAIQFQGLYINNVQREKTRDRFFMMQQHNEKSWIKIVNSPFLSDDVKRKSP